MKLACMVMIAALSIAIGSCGVDSNGSGNVQVFVEPEATISDGLRPGSGDEDIRDGWAVAYDTFIIAIGNFRAHRSAEPDDALNEPAVHVVDLRRVPAGGLLIAEFQDVAATRWDKVGFDLVNADDEALRGAGTSEDDYREMVDNGYSLHVAGTLTKEDGEQCAPADPDDCAPAPEIRFDWRLQVGTSFDDCAPASGDAGFAVPSGGTVQIKPTIHGDHWFFTDITQGAEITERRAQWIANADLDRDGETTLDELQSTPIADLFPVPPYNLSGALIPLDHGRDYLEAQARTLGDFQGEGECPTRALLP